jgi:hypothetical protein
VEGWFLPNATKLAQHENRNWKWKFLWVY